jgi:hypothetical protein
MKLETLQGIGDDGKPYVVIRATPVIIGSGLEGIPFYRLESGERLAPTSEPNKFKLVDRRTVITVGRE